MTKDEIIKTKDMLTEAYKCVANTRVYRMPDDWGRRISQLLVMLTELTVEMKKEIEWKEFVKGDVNGNQS